MIYLLTKDSTLWAFEGPERPKEIHCMGKGFCCDGRRCDWLQSKDDHEEAMSTARESALPVVNAEEVGFLIEGSTILFNEEGRSRLKLFARPGETVALPGWELDKVFQSCVSKEMKWVDCLEYQYNSVLTIPGGSNRVRQAYRLKRSEPDKVCGQTCGCKDSSECKFKPENSAHGDSFENHPLNFVAGPKPKPSREERHKRLADKIQQAKKEKVTESFTRLEMEKMFCMGMLNQRSESIVDLLSQQLPEAQSKMDKIIEEIKNRRVEPSESQEDQIDLLSEILIDYKTWLDDPQSGMRDYENFQARQLEKFTITRK